MNEKIKKEYFIDSLREYMGPHIEFEHKTTIAKEQKKPLKIIKNIETPKINPEKEEALELISALKELNYDNELSLDIIDNLEKIIKEKL